MDVMDSDTRPEIVDRRAGRSGELALRRGPLGYEIVCDGAFLISDENEVSSRAMITAARQHVPEGPLDVLIGGLGLGYALDEALTWNALRSVTVVEYEPVVVEWFELYCGERAGRAARDPRSRIIVDDVHDVLTVTRRGFDLIALDTDNGPEWLVREENARLYDPAGLKGVATALRPGGVAVFWSPDRYPEFEATLAEVFAGVLLETAHDVVGGNRFAYTMYVCVGVAEGGATGPPRPML
jgi:spermidine synthase